MCDIFADDTFTPPGDCLHQLTVFITKHQCQTVHLPGQQHIFAGCEFSQIIHGLDFICREHGTGMTDRCQFLQNLSGHFLRRRIREHQSRILFQPFEFIHQDVIVTVAHNRIVIPVVSDIRLIQFFNQFEHSLVVGFVLIRTHWRKLLSINFAENLLYFLQAIL